MVSAQVRLALQAMRYYRLWIYASNVVLMSSVVIFMSVAGALLSDPRRSLLSTTSVNLLQPSFVYAYTALVVQGGILPIVGCIGALRLSERFLNAYWLLLLILLGGDLLMGLVWLFRFQKLVAGLMPDLRQRLNLDYGNDADYTQAWDLLQKSARCCGVDSPADYNNSLYAQSVWSQSNGVAGLAPSGFSGSPGSTWQSMAADHQQAISNKVPLPESCCKAAYSEQFAGLLYGNVQKVPPGRYEVYGTGKHQKQLRDFNERYQERLMREHANNPNSPPGSVTVYPPIPGRARDPSYETATINNHRSRHSNSGFSGLMVTSTGGHRSSSPRWPDVRDTTRSTSAGVADAAPILAPVSEINGTVCWRSWPAAGSDINESGCGELVQNWLYHTGDILFVLGYCVLAFVKVCFLAILRYELREMLQKIKILQTETESSPQLHEMTGILSMASANPSNAAAVASMASFRAPPAVVATEAESLHSQATPVASPIQANPSMSLFTAVNGEVPFSGSRRMEPDREPTIESPSEHASLLAHDHDHNSHEMSSLSPINSPLCLQRLQHVNDTGADSDSGSHCPLLTSCSFDPSQPSQSRSLHKELRSGSDRSDRERDRLIKDWDRSAVVWDRPIRHDNNGWPGRTNGNNNEYHELREIKQTQI